MNLHALEKTRNSNWCSFIIIKIIIIIVIIIIKKGQII